MILRNRVAEVRVAAGLSVYELCARLGLYTEKGVIVSRSVVRLEDGEHTTAELAMAVFTVLKETGKVEKFEDLFWLEELDVEKNLEGLNQARKNKPKAVRKTRVNKTKTENDAVPPFPEN